MRKVLQLEKECAGSKAGAAPAKSASIHFAPQKARSDQKGSPAAASFCAIKNVCPTFVQPKIKQDRLCFLNFIKKNQILDIKNKKILLTNQERNGIILLYIGIPMPF